MIIAIISTLISSIALAGVAASLFLQARQLRVSQLQASRAAHFEYIRLLLDRPELATNIFAEQFRPESSVLNWYLKYFELSYLMRAASRDSVLIQITEMFAANYPYEWWKIARPIYETEASSMSKMERDFFTIVNEAFEIATQRKASLNTPMQADGDTSSSVTH